MSAAYHEGSWIEPSTQRRYQYRWWRPASVRALLIVLHGFGEHGGRYETFAQRLTQEGIWVVVPDLWGHGRSDGRRGDLGDIAACVRHLQALTEQVVLPAAGQSRYALFGHSFGGLAAIWWALGQPGPLRRLVVQSPLLEVGFPIPWWKAGAAVVLATAWPSFGFSMQLDIDALSHDRTVIEAYRSDPLVHASVSARTYRSILRTRDAIVARAGLLRVPVLMLSGGDDRIVSVEVAQRWFERVGCSKRAANFPGAYHELHHEPVWPEVSRQICAWVLADA